MKRCDKEDVGLTVVAVVETRMSEVASKRRRKRSVHRSRSHHLHRPRNRQGFPEKPCAVLAVAEAVAIEVADVLVLLHVHVSA